MPINPASLIGVSTNALVAEFLPKTFGDFVGAIVLGDFFPKDQDVLVALNFFGQGVFERLTVSN